MFVFLADTLMLDAHELPKSCLKQIFKMDCIKKFSIEDIFRRFKYEEHDFCLVTLKFRRNFKFRRSQTFYKWKL